MNSIQYLSILVRFSRYLQFRSKTPPPCRGFSSGGEFMGGGGGWGKKLSPLGPVIIPMGGIKSVAGPIGPPGGSGCSIPGAPTVRKRRRKREFTQL